MTSLPSLRTLVAAVGAVATAAVFGASPLAAETVDTINKTFSVSPGGKLAVDIDAGSIEVTAGAGDTVAIEVMRKFRASSEEKEKELLARHEVKIEQSGNTVSVHARGASGSRSMWSWFGGGESREVRVKISVPQKFDADVKTSGGPISVDGLHGALAAHTSGGPLEFEKIKGSITAHTSGGPIEIEACDGQVEVGTSGGPIEVDDCVGDFDLDTSGGPISVENHRGHVSAETSGGGIHIDGIDGSVVANTSGGSVRAAFRSQPKGDCRLSTSGGGVSVTLPASSAITLDAHTSAGGVSCDLRGGTDVEKSRGRLRASYNGGGPRLELSSSGGGISVETTGGGVEG